MNATEAFEHRRQELEKALASAQDMTQAIAACSMALEQTACELAQAEQDEHARQRQQAVMAALRRAPQLLTAVTARSELVLADEREQNKPKNRWQRALRFAGVFLLAALAVHEVIEGDMLFAGLQALGGALLLCGGRAAALPDVRARGIAQADAQALVRRMAELCRAADLCVSDLMLLEKDAGAARLCGTADEAMLDLLVSLMEAKASGREALAMRSLDQAEQYLHMLGIEIVPFDDAHEAMYDTLPTMGENRVIRPALMQDGKLLRRGVAACRERECLQGGMNR